ncbi:MAG TPA: hypothetical protein VK679_03110 [Gemmatimonadaceae bacterium]|jgi:hypothetical protein|nr:hypothetical protein [Gemmatimonadaceae bacterium]
MIHDFWLIALAIAGVCAVLACIPAIRLPVRTILVFVTGLALGAAAYGFFEPHASFLSIGLAACVASLVLVVPWTAIVLAPRRQGSEPWALIAKGLFWGPALGAVFGGFCAVIDQELAGPLVAGMAIFGFTLGPWAAASAWAGNLGVFRRGSKVKGAVDSSPHDTRVDPE